MGSSKKLTILAATAHPDDIEVFCAGTLDPLCQRRPQGFHGHRLYRECGLQDPYRSGDRSHPRGRSPERRRSDRGGIDPLGSQRCRDYGWIIATWIQYVDLVRRTNPDVIITLDRDDYVHDHSNVGELAYRAAIWASVSNIPDMQLPTHRPYPHRVPLRNDRNISRGSAGLLCGYNRGIRAKDQGVPATSAASTAIFWKNNLASRTGLSMWKLQTRCAVSSAAAVTPKPSG